MRPERLPLNAPLKYRSLRTDWLPGETVNISAGGVLFRCEQMFAVGTHVDVYLVLTTPEGVELPPLTVATGTVVRCVPPQNGTEASCMAVEFISRRDI